MEDYDMDYHHHIYYFPTIPLANLTETNCTDGVPWIRDYIGSCVLDTRHYASVIVGLMSTAFSTVNGLPQIYINCAKGIPDKALSIFLILQWLAGDSLNLTGALLTHQTNVQIIYAVFMVSVDVIMLTQYTFFKIKHAIEDKRSASRRHMNGNIQERSGSVGRSYNGSVLFACTMLWLTSYLTMDATLKSMDQTPHTFTGRKLLMSEPFFHGTKDKIGFGLGIVSTLCYMGSRLPQIYKNWQRQSTVGVAFGLFFLMILSNICYGSSILLHSTDLYPVLHSLPWITGALGMIVFDCVIMFQFWYYSGNRMHQLDISDDLGDSSRRLLDDV